MMCQRKVKNGDSPVPFCPATQMGSLNEDCAMTAMTVDSLRPGRPISGHWLPPTCWRSGSNGLVDQLQGQSRATASTLITGTICGGNHEDEAKGAIRPQLVDIAKGTQKGRQTQSPSPSLTRPWKHVTFKDPDSTSEEDHSMRWQAGQSPHNRKPTEYDFEPPPTLEPDIEHFLGEPIAAQEEEGVQPLKEPLVENYEIWAEWRGLQLVTPDWWGG